MFTAIIPKLPMRDKAITLQFYKHYLGFNEFGNDDYEGYLMIRKDEIELHFFEFKELNIKENDGQVYIRIENINAYYKTLLEKNTKIHPNGQLQIKPWNQIEFAVLDPDHNLLTFGQNVLSKPI